VECHTRRQRLLTLSLGYFIYLLQVNVTDIL
jgi:hypothetical protein